MDANDADAEPGAEDAAIMDAMAGKSPDELLAMIDALMKGRLDSKVGGANQ